MAFPWLRVLNAVIGIGDLTRMVKGRAAANPPADPDQVGAGGRVAALETRLAGVVVAALKEAFDRDHQRLEFEREQMAADRLRAERALRIELARQAGDQEIGRLRLLAGVAVVSWLGTLLFAARLVGAETASRVTFGIGWLLLLGSLAASFVGQSAVTRGLNRTGDSVSPGPAGELAPWLLVSGLAVIGFGVLIA
jgi:hypothetical protein